ncbi:hypothetical protein Ancab_016403 [Ancistrocladus abbreviatus]
MQGQRSAIGSLPDSINFDYGSTSNNMGIDQQICWNNLQDAADSRLSDYRISASGMDTYMGTVSQEGQNLSRWGVGVPSSSEPHSLISHDEPMTQSVWSSSMNASATSGPMLEAQRNGPSNFVSRNNVAQRNGPSNFVSRNNVNLNLNSTQIVNGPSFVHCSDSGSSAQSYDLNVGLLGPVGADLMEGPNSSKSSVLVNKLNPSASSSSDTFASSSGSGGFLMEDDDGRPGCSLDGRRLSCKRKAFEGNAGQSSSSGTCFPRAESSMWQAVAPCYDVGSSSMNVSPLSESSFGASSTDQVNPRLGLGVVGVPSDNQGLTVAGSGDSSQRSYRLRMNPSSQHESISSNSFSPGANHHGHSDVPPAHQPLRLVPVSPPLDLMSRVPPENAAQQSQSVVLHVPSLRRHVQSLRWNGASSSRPGSSSAAAALGERDAPLNEDLTSRTMPRNIADDPMFTPAIETRNSAQNTPNWSLNGGNLTMSRNVTASSRTGPSSGSHSSSGPNWASHRNVQSQYSRRFSEYVRRSLLSSAGSETVAQSGNIAAHRSIPASTQEGALPSGSGSQRHNQSFSRSALWMERQGDGVVGIPYSLRTFAAAGEGRSRLVSEIRNVLDIMRRGEGLRFEDVMILDQTVLFGMADIHDQHRDMRLDVDNMSYEELLALEERIGNVCTGLSEETVMTRMKQRKYLSLMSVDQTEAEPCCICQEEYNDGDDLGILDCGHDFHTDCIKQWLAQKNLCPICKTTALAT